MKSYIVYFLLIVSSCSCNRKLVYYGGHFTVEQINEIKDKSGCTSFITIIPLQINKNKQIGLYGYTCGNKSKYLLEKVLKHEDKLVFYSCSDKDENTNAIEEFTNRYSGYLNRRQKMKIRESFIKGPQLRGSFL